MAAYSYVSKDYVIPGASLDLRDLPRLWGSVDKRVRTSIRKGEALGARIRLFRLEKDLAAVRAFTKNEDDIPKIFEERHTAFVAEHPQTGEIIGWILLVLIEKKIFLLCHASNPLGKTYQVPNLLIWHAIKYFAERGYAWLDVGASYRPSLQKYFQGYGQISYPMVMRPTELALDLRITPFDTAAYGIGLGSSQAAERRLNEVFGTDIWTFFPRARHAITACLREWREEGRLTSEDEVWVVPTSGTPYVSSCVTQAIEVICQWSLVASERTRVVFMIHEFGFPHPRAGELRAFCDARGIPLVEDLAYGWGGEGIGRWGDITIVSFTKLLPVQFGGALVGRSIPFERLWHTHGCADEGKKHETLALLDAIGLDLTEIRTARQSVWKAYAERLQMISVPYYQLEPGIVPGAYLARLSSEEEMKRVSAFVNRFGIEAGNWHHHQTIFLPCHQRMTMRHIDYVCGAVLASFREGCGIPPGG